MSFKVLGDFPSHYMIQHPDGSSFPVAKKGISEDLHKKIKAIGSMSNPQKLFDGGSVLDPADQPTATPAQSPSDFSDLQSNQPLPASNERTVGQKLTDIFVPKGIQDAGSALMNKISDVRDIADQASASAPTATSNITPALAQPGIAPPLQKASVETGIPDQAPDPMDSYKRMTDSLGKQQSQVGTYSQEMNASNQMAQKAKEDLISGAQKIDDEHQSNIQELKSKDAELSNAYLTGKADPNRVYNNMNTGNKVMAAISLALGGIGSGLTGRPNAALEVISNAITKDMEAQKSDMEKQKYGVMLNHEAQRDETSNYTVKKASLLTAAQAQIGLATLRSSNAQAKLQGGMMIQGLQNQKDQIFQEYSIKKSAFDAIQKNPGDTGVLSHAVTLIVPKEQQPEAFKELNRVQAAVKARDSINQFFGGANDKNTIMGRIMHGGAEPADMSALQANIMPVIKDLEGRVNEQEIEILHKLSPSPGDSAGKVKTKLDGLNKFISAKADSSLLSGYGLMPRGEGVYNDKGQKNFKEGAPR